MDSHQRRQLYRTTHLWHWISAAVCFAALTLFTITGITLNHAQGFWLLLHVPRRDGGVVG